MAPALQTIEETFHAALECEPGQLSTFLDTRCAGDEALRAKVEALLASHRRAETSVEISIAAVAASIVGNGQLDSLTGATIGHYRIENRIGAGGMGEVYLASDINVGRTAALKLLPAHLSGNEERLRRFQQEARAVAGLNHPNIMTIYEVGTDNSRRYIVSELIEGETLHQRLARGRLEVKEAIEIAIQVASALVAAHSASVVHRDIKPQNIMLRPDDYVKVLDFGIAKLAEQELPATITKTEALRFVETNVGSILGTVSYMSPEQARGAPVDQRTDIWSLGVVLYEMVTARPPFTGDTPAQVLTQILTTEPQPVSSSELQQIVSRTLRKDPKDRYQSANEMLDALKGLRRKLEFSAERQHSAVNQPPLLWKRSRIAVVLAFLIPPLILVLSFQWLRHRTISPAPEKSIAVLPFEYFGADKTDAYLADGIQAEILTRLSKIADLKVISRASTERYKTARPRNLRQIAAELGVAHILEGSVQKAHDQMHITVQLINGQNDSQLWADDYEGNSADIFALEKDIATKIANTLQAKLTGAEQRAIASRPTQNSEAHRMYLMGAYYWNKSLIPFVEKSRDYFQQAIDLDPKYAAAYAGLADDYGFAAANGMMAPAEGWPKAQAALERALALDETLAEPYNTLAAIKLYQDRDWPAAERMFLRGIELNPNFAEIHIHYAVCLMLFGRNDDAIKEIRRAVELDPVSLRSNASRAKVLFFVRQYDRAIEQLRKTLELDPNYPLAHKWLGYAYEKKGMQKEAIAEWSKALNLSGEEASILESTYATSGFDAAVRALAEKQLEQSRQKTAQGRYVAAGDFVTTYMRLGDTEQAFAWLTKAMEERNRFAFEVRVDPIFDSLRGDPRFEKIVDSLAPK